MQISAAIGEGALTGVRPGIPGNLPVAHLHASPSFACLVVMGQHQAAVHPNFHILYVSPVLERCV